MPVPIPRPNEEKDAYISHCIKRLHDIDPIEQTNRLSQCATAPGENTGEELLHQHRRGN